MENNKYNTDEFNTILLNRRSVKPETFSDKRVEQKILNQILENANWAPTHAFTEPWRFIIFEGKGRKTLGEFEAYCYKKKTSPETFVQKKYDKALNRPLKATYVIALCMKRQVNGRKILPEIEEIAAVSCAVQNMFLTATAYGVDAYWGSGGATYSDEMKDFLGLEEIDHCLGFLYLGYSDQQRPKGRRLSDIDEKLKWIQE